MKSKNLVEIIKKIEKAKSSAKAKQLTKRIIMKPTKYHFQCGIEETCEWILKDLKMLEVELLRHKESLEYIGYTSKKGKGMSRHQYGKYMKIKEILGIES